MTWFGPSEEVKLRRQIMREKELRAQVEQKLAREQGITERLSVRNKYLEGALEEMSEKVQELLTQREPKTIPLDVDGNKPTMTRCPDWMVW